MIRPVAEQLDDQPCGGENVQGLVEPEEFGRGNYRRGGPAIALRALQSKVVDIETSQGKRDS
jgi:hypothetical protein